MKILHLLEQNFSGSAIDEDISDSIISSFEKRWGRRLPHCLREFLLEINGVAFEQEVMHLDLQVVGFMSLWGIESFLTSYQDIILPTLLPFAGTLANAVYCLDCKDEKCPVFLMTYSTGYPLDIAYRQQSLTIDGFINQLEVRQ